MGECFITRRGGSGGRAKVSFKLVETHNTGSIAVGYKTLLPATKNLYVATPNSLSKYTLDGQLITTAAISDSGLQYARIVGQSSNGDYVAITNSKVYIIDSQSMQLKRVSSLPISYKTIALYGDKLLCRTSSDFVVHSLDGTLILTKAISTGSTAQICGAFGNWALIDDVYNLVVININTGELKNIPNTIQLNFGATYQLGSGQNLGFGGQTYNVFAIKSSPILTVLGRYSRSGTSDNIIVNVDMSKFTIQSYQRLGFSSASSYMGNDGTLYTRSSGNRIYGEHQSDVLDEDIITVWDGLIYSQTSSSTLNVYKLV